MAHRSDLDLVKENTSTTGTGTLTLAGAVSGFVGVCHATNGLLADGDTGWFVARNGAEWEMFLGTRGGGGTTLARTTRLKSSTGAAVSFTSAPVVYGVIPGVKLTMADGPAFSAYLPTANQSITNGVATKVNLTAEEFDTNGQFDTTNKRFTPLVAGYYQISWGVRLNGTNITNAWAALYKNGASFKRSSDFTATASGVSTIGPSGSVLVYMNGSTDYAELFVYCAATSPEVQYLPYVTYMSGALVRPA